MSADLIDDRAEILDALDLVELFGELVGPQGRNRQWPCPIHEGQTGKSPPVSLTPKDHPTYWKCHSCGEGGSAIDLLIATRGLSLREAFDAVRERTGKRRRADLTGRSRPTPTPRPRPTPPPAAAPTIDDARPLEGDDAERLIGRYLEHRRWPAELVAEAGLSAVRRYGRPAIRHPFTINGKCYGWQDRALGGEGSKWLASKGWVPIPHGLDQLAHLGERHENRRRAVVLTEGPADALTIRATWPTAAALGCPGVENWSARATAMLAAAGVTLVLVAFDNDDAGARGFDEVSKALHVQRIDARRVSIPDEYNDLTDWATGAGAAFVPTFARVLKGAAGQLIGTPPLSAPLLGDRREVAV